MFEHLIRVSPNKMPNYFPKRHKAIFRQSQGVFAPPPPPAQVAPSLILSLSVCVYKFSSRFWRRIIVVFKATVMKRVVEKSGVTT